MLSYELCVCNLHVEDTVFSDHKPILFDIVPLSPVIKQVAPVPHCRAFSSDTAEHFSTLFDQLLSRRLSRPPQMDHLDFTV